MRNLSILIALMLSANLYSQITIMDNPVKTPMDPIKTTVVEVVAYDSQKNMSPEKYYGLDTYHHLIGQTLLYCGYPNSYGVKPNIKVGNYYRVDSVLYDYPDIGKYQIICLTNLETKEKAEDWESFSKMYNFKWVVVGHYEKIKSLYINKDFVYMGKRKNMSYYDMDMCGCTSKTKKKQRYIVIR